MLYKMFMYQLHTRVWFYVSFTTATSCLHEFICKNYNNKQQPIQYMKSYYIGIETMLINFIKNLVLVIHIIL